ncbi:TF2H4 factor, partial [Polyodon spathula]|nr:TF2H4 factor [Polyodon spathula]
MKLREQLRCKNLHEFLKEMSPAMLDRLYNHPATCLAVFRELPQLAKNYVMRMLFLEQPLPQAAVAYWVKKENQKEHDESTGVLTGLRLWHTQQLPGGLQGLILNPIFKDNLRIALLGGGKAWADDTSQFGPDKHARDIDSLNKYAIERWEGSSKRMPELFPVPLGKRGFNKAFHESPQCPLAVSTVPPPVPVCHLVVILHFMVGSPSAAVSQDLAQLLIQAGLMRSEAGDAPCITSAGFQFLLLDTASQLWYFTLQYLKTAESRGMDLVEILSFLFQLSFSTLGRSSGYRSDINHDDNSTFHVASSTAVPKHGSDVIALRATHRHDYSVEGMSDSLLTFLQHLREFGLVFQRKRKSRRYYPTRLAINLAAGVSGTSVDAHNQGFVVVETNYRIYAYTESELQIALVALFSELLYRFPNLIVAQVTRESVQQAIANGITAEQIIHFLRTRAHPVMLKQTPVLPPTITDQIALWELERDRLQFSEGVLYNQFLSQVDFEVLRNHAKDLGVLIWENPQNRVMVVTQAGHSDVKKFWKRQKH